MARSCDACNGSWAQVKRAGPAPTPALLPGGFPCVCVVCFVCVCVCIPPPPPGAPLAKKV